MTKVIVGELTGVRAWKAVANHAGPMLRSLVYPEKWLPGQTLEAQDAELSDQTFARGPGIYAFKPSASLGLLNMLVPYLCRNRLNEVMGEVALWGDVREHEAGYRAEFAKITKLYSSFTLLRNPKTYFEGQTIPFQSAHTYANLYGVPCEPAALSLTKSETSALARSVVEYELQQSIRSRNPQLLSVSKLYRPPRVAQSNQLSDLKVQWPVQVSKVPHNPED